MVILPPSARMGAEAPEPGASGLTAAPDDAERVLLLPVRETRQADFAFAGLLTGAIIVTGALYGIFTHIMAVLLISALLSYALLPAVDLLNRWMPRWLAVTAVALGGAGLLVLIGMLAFPTAARELEGLGGVVRQTQEALLRGWNALLEWLPTPIANWLSRFGTSLARGATASAPSVGTLGEWARTTGGSVAAFATGILFVPVFVIVMLRGLPRVGERAIRAVPPRWRPRWRERGAQLNRVLAGFIRGQLLVALVLGVAYAVAFSIIGIPLAIVVGLVAGFGELVPYLGGAIALLLGSLMAIAGGQPLDVLWVVVTFAALQGLEGTVLSPLIVGSRAKLGAATVIVALAIGGQLFGVVGLLLAVPVAAMLKVAGIAAVDGYRATDFYRHGAPTTGD
ncbi:MAG TPA: AI-2E family transporter [Gemmatimonadaceae bacterium]|nr:AI-2E family transporter [Gemmatimonadaceae bacterium]